MFFQFSLSICHMQISYYVISEGSELEINIGYDDRARLTNLMSDEEFFMESNLSINDLFTIFDDAASEVLKLLMSSFLRFQHKPEWKTACKMLDDSK